MGRVLGGIRLSGLRFFDGVLFFRKKSFYVFLSPNQFLHLVPCLAVIRVRSFLLGQQFCKLRIKLLDLRQLLQPGFVKSSFRRLVQSDFLPVSFQKLLTVPRLAVFSTLSICSRRVVICGIRFCCFLVWSVCRMARFFFTKASNSARLLIE